LAQIALSVIFGNAGDPVFSDHYCAVNLETPGRGELWDIRSSIERLRGAIMPPKPRSPATTHWPLVVTGRWRVS
jgi:hypothetical protein